MTGTTVTETTATEGSLEEDLADVARAWDQRDIRAFFMKTRAAMRHCAEEIASLHAEVADLRRRIDLDRLLEQQGVPQARRDLARRLLDAERPSDVTSWLKEI